MITGQHDMPVTSSDYQEWNKTRWPGMTDF